MNYYEIAFINLLGEYKSILVPKERFDEIKNKGLSCDGSSVEICSNAKDSDYKLNIDTTATYPLPDNNTLVFAEIDYLFDARKNLRSFEKKHFGNIYIGAELEFFLFEKNKRILDKQKYFSKIENRAKNCLLSVAEFCSKSNIKIELIHHECANNQYELDFRFDTPTKTADKIVYIKYLLRYFANKNNLVACFMPKPLNNQSGSGMHTNISIFDNDKNLFYSKKDRYGLSKFAKNFIENIIYHIGGITAFACSNNNSYKRLSAKMESPSKIKWSFCDRTALIRIPKADKDATRIELRLPDVSANPYLLFLSVLTAGFDNSKQTKRAIKVLPKNLKQSINCLKTDNLLSTLVPNIYIEKKLLEYEEYTNMVTNLDIAKYFDI